MTKKPAWYKEEYGQGLCGDNTSCWLNAREYLNGTNITFRKDLLKKLDWFDETLGMIDKKIKYGEETMIQIRAWGLNPALRVYYSPDAFVMHLVAEYKMDILWHLRSAYQLGFSQAYFWNRNIPCRKSDLILTIGRHIAGLIKAVFQTPLRDRVRYPYWQNYAYEVWAKKMVSIAQSWVYLLHGWDSI